MSSYKLLDDPNFSTSNGSPIDQFQGTAGQNQEWQLLEPGNGYAGTYFVDNAFVHVTIDSGGSTSEGTGVVAETRNSGVNQQWTFVPLFDGHDLIVNVASGLVLDDPPSFTSPISSTSPIYVDQWQLNDGANQEWNIVPESGGTVAIFNENDAGALGILRKPGPARVVRLRGRHLPAMVFATGLCCGNGARRTTGRCAATPTRCHQQRPAGRVSGGPRIAPPARAPSRAAYGPESREAVSEQPSGRS